MKTLDEVIKAFEVCMSEFEDCIGCPYANETGEPLCCGDDKEDALHYLKELQKIEDEYDELKDWWAEEHAENVPLTWDELKHMEGKPVWIEIGKNGNHWLIITDVMKNGAVGRGMYGENVPLYQDSIGKSWQAYRKEKENDPRRSH